MEFEWDEVKAKTNLRKHKVDFKEAATVFGDFLSRTFFESSAPGRPRHLKGRHMKKKTKRIDKDDLRPEYDASFIRSGVRGKYAKRYHDGTNLVLLAPDVAAVFPDANSVNNALRLLMSVAKQSASNGNSVT